MGQLIARKDDKVVGVDTHIVLIPTPGGPAPTPLPHAHSGALDGNLATSVKANGRPVALVDSTSTNQPAHMPTPPGTAFQSPPANKGTVMMGSMTVKVQGRAVARLGDPVRTCNDPADAPVGQVVVAGGTVMVGG